LTALENPSGNFRVDDDNPCRDRGTKCVVSRVPKCEAPGAPTYRKKVNSHWLCGPDEAVPLLQSASRVESPVARTLSDVERSKSRFFAYHPHAPPQKSKDRSLGALEESAWGPVRSE